MPVAVTLILLQLSQKWPETGVMIPMAPAAPSILKFLAGPAISAPTIGSSG